MISFTHFILAATVLASHVFSAPAPPLDAATLLQNGQDAQSLNSEFQNLSTNDPCTSGQTACISTTTALCVNDRWTTGNCLKSLQCFALPSVRERGTFVSCTSEAEALSIISATGASGGILSTNSSTDNVPFPSSSSTTASTDCTTSGSSSVTQNDGATETETVTIILASGATVTLPSQTQTLAPDAASSLLSSLLANGANGGATVFPSATISLTTSSATTSPVANGAAAVTPAPSAESLSLTSAALTTIQLTARPASAAVAATTTTDASGSNSGY